MAMRIFILAAMAALACSMPIEVEQGGPYNLTYPPFPILNQTVVAVPGFGAGMFNFTFGNCSFKDMSIETSLCERQFFLQFRQEEPEPCSMALQELKECLLDGVEACYEGHPEEHVNTMIEVFEKSMTDLNKFYCSDELYKMSDLFSGQHFNITGSSCAAGFDEQIYQCQAPVLKRFKNNRGDPKLCGEYDNSVKCMNKTLSTFCGVKFNNNSNWVFSRELNPFCDEEQLEQGTKEKFEEEDDHEHDHDEHEHDEHEHEEREHDEHEHDEHEHDKHEHEDNYHHEDDKDEDKEGGLFGIFGDLFNPSL